MEPTTVAKTGQAVTSFRVPSIPCYWDQASSEWEGAGHPPPGLLGLAVACRSCGESLIKGKRVIVTGRLRQRSYDAPDGSKRTVYELQADDLGPPIRTATVQDHYLYARDGGADLELTRRPARSGQRSPRPRKLSA
jgi:single-strand DNA-binding protein